MLYTMVVKNGKKEWKQLTMETLGDAVG